MIIIIDIFLCPNLATILKQKSIQQSSQVFHKLLLTFTMITRFLGRYKYSFWLWSSLCEVTLHSTKLLPDSVNANRAFQKTIILFTEILQISICAFLMRDVSTFIPYWDFIMDVHIFFYLITTSLTRSPINQPNNQSINQPIDRSIGQLSINYFNITVLFSTSFHVKQSYYICNCYIVLFEYWLFHVPPTTMPSPLFASIVYRFGSHHFPSCQ